MITADTITDEQIRELRETEARWLDANPASAIGDRIRYDDWSAHHADFLAAEKALGNRRAPRGGKRKARARCAEILNAREAKPSFVATCDKCEGENDRANESNYCTRCSAEYQARIALDPETQPVGTKP